MTLIVYDPEENLVWDQSWPIEEGRRLPKGRAPRDMPNVTTQGHTFVSLGVPDLQLVADVIDRLVSGKQDTWPLRGFPNDSSRVAIIVWTKDNRVLISRTYTSTYLVPWTHDIFAAGRNKRDFYYALDSGLDVATAFALATQPTDD